MDSLVIEGGRRLKGLVEVPASKNASLPLMCLSLMTDQPVRFSNLPQVSDILSMKALLASLGVHQESHGHFHSAKLKSVRAEYDLVRKMRASILCLGPLVARWGRAEVSLPGGCAIGERPVDIHLKGLELLGAEIKLEGGYIHAKANRLKGCRLPLEFPTVTGTINLMMAAALADGESVISNAAREPEVAEVAEALRTMGLTIEGEGSPEIKIQGKQDLNGLDWQIQADRIQLITYLAAGAITGGEVTCTPYRPKSIDRVIEKFRDMGCSVEESASKILLSAKPPFKPVNIETAPFPGFPTDAQAQFMACLTLGDPEGGFSRIRETIFENRFQHVSELRRMGAQIRLRGNLASIKGVSHLSGASVMASDLRASASLVLAGLAAHGQTQVLRVYHLDRGYEKLEEKLTALGAQIRRVPQ